MGLLRFFYTWINCRRIASFADRPTVNGWTVLSQTTHLGKNCHFNGMRIRGSGKVTIGDNFHSGQGVKIITSFHDYDGGDTVPYGLAVAHRDVVIKSNVWLGDDVLVLGGVTLEEGAIVQAGSVVVDNIGYCSIVGGAPAKEFKKRNIEHYENMRNAGKFA